MKSTITINVHLDEKKVPEKIEWAASDSKMNALQMAKSVFLSLWDTKDKNTMCINLWTKEMMVDEMFAFFYQTIMNMSDTLLNATQEKELTNEMKAYAEKFRKQSELVLLRAAPKKQP